MISQLLNPNPDETLDLELVKKYLKKYTKPNVDADDIMAEDSEYNFGGQLAQEFISKIGSDKFPQVSNLEILVCVSMMWVCSLTL